MEISTDENAAKYREQRYKGHKSTLNIVRMREGMQMSDPAIMLLVKERDAQREIAR